MQVVLLAIAADFQVGAGGGVDGFLGDCFAQLDKAAVVLGADLSGHMGNLLALLFFKGDSAFGYATHDLIADVGPAQLWVGVKAIGHKWL